MNTIKTQLPAFAKQITKGMKTFILGMVAILASSSAARAADSTWLLGDNGKIAVSTHEHRAGAGRATSVTLIYGVHLLVGELKDTDSGPITLREISDGEEDKANNFKGQITVDYERTRVTLAGNLDLGAGPQKINFRIGCKEMGRL